MSGEGVGLVGGEGGEVQAVGRGAEVGRADIARPLQDTEGGVFGAVCVRSARTQRLGHRQGNGVQGRARVQEVSRAGQEVVDVIGEVPVVRAHAS